MIGTVFPQCTGLEICGDRSTPQLAPKFIPVDVEAFLARDEPFLDRLAPVERASAYFDAWWASPSGVPAIKCPFANLELVCKLRYSQIRGQDCAGALHLLSKEFRSQFAPSIGR
jgi:hypothetical protein